MKSVLSGLTLLAALAAAPAFAACEDPAAFCGKLIAPNCLTAYGAGSTPAKPAAQAPKTCESQFAAYGDCLGDIAERCGGASAPAPAPAPSAGAAPAVPAGHAILAETQADASRFAFLLAPAPVTWSAAERHAMSMGGRLAVIDTPAKQAAIAAALARRPELFHREQVLLSGWFFGPWFGGFQQAGAPDPRTGWRWSLDPKTGASAPIQTAYWLPGNPNDFGGAEDFAHFFCIDRPTCDTWNDSAYDAPVRAYIVEFKP